MNRDSATTGCNYIYPVQVPGGSIFIASPQVLLVDQAYGCSPLCQGIFLQRLEDEKVCGSPNNFDTKNLTKQQPTHEIPSK